MLSSLLLSLVLLASPPTVAETVAPLSAPSGGMLPTPQFRRYGTVNGLPSSSVYTVVQGPDGAMSFATKGGIARYDGVGFKVFRHVADDPGSLRDNGISTLAFDRAGHLGAGGLEAALNRYDPQTDKFQHWTHDPADPHSLGSDKVWVIKPDSDGALLVGTALGLDRMRPDGTGFEHIPAPDHDVGGFGAVGALYVDAKQRLWIGGTKGVFLRDTNGVIRPVPYEHPSEIVDAWRIEGDGDEMRIASARGLLVVDKDGVMRMFCKDIADFNVLSSTRDRAGRLWIGTQRGMYLQTVPGGPVQPLVNQPLLYGNLRAPGCGRSCRIAKAVYGSPCSTAAWPISRPAGIA